LWKAFIDFEIEQEEYERVRELYQTLLRHTNHIKVWASWTAFEVGIDNIEGARSVFQRANNELSNSSNEERLLLLETWSEFERDHGTEETQDAVRRNMPVKRKRRRRIQTKDGADVGYEEYFEYEFPDKKGLFLNVLQLYTSFLGVKTKNKLLDLAKGFAKPAAPIAPPENVDQSVSMES
jgi:crooked neck